MPTFRELIVQANAGTREKFVYWCLFGRNLERETIPQDDVYGLISSQIPPLESRSLSWLDDPALDDDLRLRYAARHAAKTLNHPYDRHKHQTYEDVCFAKLQALVEAQKRPLSFEEWQILRYTPSVRFREFDALIQRAAPSVREEFVRWCIEAWAKPSLVEILYLTLLSTSGQELEDERDWLMMQRLVQRIQEETSHWSWWSLDLQLMERNPLFQNMGRPRWRAYQIRLCAYLRLVAFNEALNWHHNILIDDEVFRIRNVAFCATKAAITPVPNIDRPISDAPDLFIWAMTHKLQSLVVGQS